VFMGSDARIGIVAVLVFLLVAYCFNPSYEDFRYIVKTEVQGQLGVQQGGLVGLVAGNLTDKAVDSFLDGCVRYQDRKIFSVVTMAPPGEERAVLIGGFGGFVCVRQGDKWCFKGVS
jgi:hypothetical protein